MFSSCQSLSQRFSASEIAAPWVWQTKPWLAKRSPMESILVPPVRGKGAVVEGQDARGGPHQLPGIRREREILSQVMDVARVGGARRTAQVGTSRRFGRSTDTEWRDSPAFRGAA